MALPSLFTSFLPSSIGHKPSLSFFRHPRFCSSSSASFGSRSVTCASKIEDQEIVRRSANWQPSVWDYDFVQSLSVDHTDKFTEQVQRLKEEVKGLFDREMNQVAKLEFIDVVQRLGLGYHFETEIKDALRSIHSKTGDAQLSDDLYFASLRFRLLRQHGYDVPQDVFQRFMNKGGTFIKSLNKNVKGLLNLYEASFHGLEGETIVDEAWNFAFKHLKDLNLDEVPTIWRAT
ncbi:Glutathione transferase [Psidium guajava]|nr:Glutathione transferase [Psidium guajava]